MAAQTYQIEINIRDAVNKGQAAREAAAVFASLMENGFAYGLAMVDVSYNSGTGFMRVRLSDPLPATEVESFGGLITAV
jgi:hypothetical protein